MKKEEPKPSTFDNLWEERLKDYPQTQEFKTIYQELLDKFPVPERKLKTPVVISMIGIPGTGKSTFSKLLQETIPAVHLRSDVIGLFMLPKAPNDDYYKAYVIQHALARRFLADGYSVIMDDNNRTRYNRERDYKMGKKYGAKNLLFNLHLPLEVAVKRAHQRDVEEGRKIFDASQMRKMLLAFQSQIEEPTPQEIKEWDVLYQEVDLRKSIEELRAWLKKNKTLQLNFLLMANSE